MPAHGPGEHHLFQVAALAHHVVNRIAVRHAYGVLLDDGPLIETRRDVMTGSADQFNPSLEGLVIRPGAQPAGKSDGC